MKPDRSKAGLLRWLAPDLHIDSIYDLNLDALRRRGIRGIITDLDNTLVGWTERIPTDRLLKWIADATDAGFRMCIVSNNRSERVRAFSRIVKVPAIWGARKPRRRAFREAIRALGLQPGETAVVGDQIFTDVLGGNRLGLYTILVVPVDRREFIGTRLARRLEKFVLRILKEKGALA
ncbi:MAG: YqeG family HAD IIIA-type phosphatase [Firmicutes bacterium]|nr:YqeG family HAD IIIA-type phosphatase [Bacillota bacterium]